MKSRSSRKEERQVPTTAPGALKFRKRASIGQSCPGHQYSTEELDRHAEGSLEVCACDPNLSRVLSLGRRLCLERHIVNSVSPWVAGWTGYWHLLETNG